MNNIEMFQGKLMYYIGLLIFISSLIAIFIVFGLIKSLLIYSVLIGNNLMRNSFVFANFEKKKGIDLFKNKQN